MRVLVLCVVLALYLLVMLCDCVYSQNILGYTYYLQQLIDTVYKHKVAKFGSWEIQKLAPCLQVLYRVYCVTKMNTLNRRLTLILLTWRIR